MSIFTTSNIEQLQHRALQLLPLHATVIRPTVIATASFNLYQVQLVLILEEGSEHDDQFGCRTIVRQQSH